MPTIRGWILVSLILYLSLVPLIFWVSLPSALAERRVAAELTTAFADPVVAAGHAWELIVIVLLIVLMVTKPF